MTAPLPPYLPESAVARTMPPLVVKSLLPLRSTMEPPVLVLPVPPSSATAPPEPRLELPALIDMAPPGPVLSAPWPDPATIAILPPLPPLTFVPEPACT